jgi:hypothetical protein
MFLRLSRAISNVSQTSLCHMKCSVDLIPSYEMFHRLDRVISLLFHRLDCHHMKFFVDLIASYEMFHRLDRVISLLFHRLDCHHMKCSVHLIASYEMFHKLNRVISLLFHKLDCRHMKCFMHLMASYEMFYKLNRVISLLFHRLDCRHMKCSVDLIVSYEMFHRLDRVISLLFNRLDCCHMKCSVDLIVSYEMFHRLDRVISLFVAIPLIFFPLSFLCISSFIGTGDATHMLEENVVAENVNEIAVVSHLSRPTPKVGSSVAIGAIFSEVADFFRKFEKRTPSPHPKWYFWKFEGSLVSFGDFWVSSDSVPYL